MTFNVIVPLLLSLRGSSGVLLCGVEVSYPGLISLLTVPRPEELGDLLKVATLGESRAESVSLGFAMPGCLWAGGGVRWLPPRCHPLLRLAGLYRERRASRERSSEKKEQGTGVCARMREAVKACAETGLSSYTLYATSAHLLSVRLLCWRGSKDSRTLPRMHTNPQPPGN